MALDLTSLEKAITSLDTALEVYCGNTAADDSVEKEMMRDGVIQRFEYTYELCWKMLKRYLEEYGLEKPDGLTNKQFFRIGHEQGMLRDAEAWFDYLEKRNLTSHTYNEATAREVYESAADFLRDAKFLLAKLKEKAR